MICICIIANSCSHQQKTANRTAVIVKKTIVKCLNFHSKHRSVTDLAKPDPVDLFPRGGVLPYMGHIGMCRCEGYGFQAAYSSIGYINQSVWV